jgi:hypothetical protein
MRSGLRALLFVFGFGFIVAWGGASFETNRVDADVQRLLRQHWDHVILQAESRAQANAANNAKFETCGEKLIAAARATRSPAVLIVTGVMADHCTRMTIGIRDPATSRSFGRRTAFWLKGPAPA